MSKEKVGRWWKIPLVENERWKRLYILFPYFIFYNFHFFRNNCLILNNSKIINLSIHCIFNTNLIIFLNLNPAIFCLLPKNFLVFLVILFLKFQPIQWFSYRVFYPLAFSILVYSCDTFLPFHELSTYLSALTHCSITNVFLLVSNTNSDTITHVVYSTK